MNILLAALTALLLSGVVTTPVMFFVYVIRLQRAARRAVQPGEPVPRVNPFFGPMPSPECERLRGAARGTLLASALCTATLLLLPYLFGTPVE